MAGESYKGKVVKNATQVLGMATWQYTGEEQRTAEYTEFGSKHEQSLPVIIAGGEVTVTGRFIQGDPGIVLLQTAFDSQEHITDIKFYKNAANYITPDPAVSKEDGTTFASYCILTKSPKALNFDTAGLGQIELTFKVSGQMKDY